MKINYYQISKIIGSIAQVQEKYLSDYIQKYPNKFEDFDSRQKELWIELNLFKFILAISKYLEINDELIAINSSTMYEKEITFLRNDKTETIRTFFTFAGGYNIQCYHVRFLIKTTVKKQKTESNEKLIKLSKVQKKEEKIKRSIETYKVILKNYNDDIKKRNELTPEEIVKLGFQFPDFETLVERNAPVIERYNTKEKYDSYVKKEQLKDIESYVNRTKSIERHRDSIIKSISKLEEKLLMLNK